MGVQVCLWKDLLELRVQVNTYGLWLSLRSLSSRTCGKHLVVTVAKLVDLIFILHLDLVSLRLLFYFKVLVLQEVVRVESVGIGIINFVLTHVMLLKLHVLDSTLGSKPNVLIILEATQLIVLVIKLENLVLKYLQYLVTGDQAYMHLDSRLNDFVLKQELEQVKVLHQVKHLRVTTLVEREDRLMLHLDLRCHEETSP